MRGSKSSNSCMNMLGGEEQIEFTNPDIHGTTFASGSLGGGRGTIFPFSTGCCCCMEEEEEEEAAEEEKCSPSCSPTRMKAIFRQRLSNEAKSGVAITSRVSAAIFVKMMSSRVICCCVGGAAAASPSLPPEATPQSRDTSGLRVALISDWKVGGQMA